MKTLPFFFCAYFCGVHDPGVSGEKGRLIGILPLREYMRIKESQFLIESGNLLGSESLVHSVLFVCFFGKNPSESCIFWKDLVKKLQCLFNANGRFSNINNKEIEIQRSIFK